MYGFAHSQPKLMEDLYNLTYLYLLTQYNNSCRGDKKGKKGDNSTIVMLAVPFLPPMVISCDLSSEIMLNAPEMRFSFYYTAFQALLLQLTKSNLVATLQSYYQLNNTVNCILNYQFLCTRVIGMHCYSNFKYGNQGLVIITKGLGNPS